MTNTNLDIIGLLFFYSSSKTEKRLCKNIVKVTAYSSNFKWTPRIEVDLFTCEITGAMHSTAVKMDTMVYVIAKFL